MLMAVVSAGMHVRSQRVRDSWGDNWYEPQRHTYHRHWFYSGHGQILWCQFDDTFVTADAVARAVRLMEEGTDSDWRHMTHDAREYGRIIETPWERLGFRFWREHIALADLINPRGADEFHFEVGVPYWFIGVLCAVPILSAAAKRWGQRRRRRRGLCPKCGYDLRVATSGRCPECGDDVPGALTGSDGAEPGITGANVRTHMLPFLGHRE
jgi:hypothetical protein